MSFIDRLKIAVNELLNERTAMKSKKNLKNRGNPRCKSRLRSGVAEHSRSAALRDFRSFLSRKRDELHNREKDLREKGTFEKVRDRLDFAEAQLERGRMIPVAF